MTSQFSRTAFQALVAKTFADPALVMATLGDAALPDTLRQWLTRLMLLHGVPINYLVPDERMLPPESIRFFYLDMNWVDALIDGAFSIGRNLVASGSSASHTVDRAALPLARSAMAGHAGAIRANVFGIAAPAVSLQTVSGFLLRSSVVRGYPGMGVRAYPKGATPLDPSTTLLRILRFEQLGPASDTLICLLDGDASQVDLHEAPEGLHYGIDRYDGPAAAGKMIRSFTRGTDGASISLSTDPAPLAAMPQCFRTASPRTLMMHTLAAAIRAQLGQAVDSAEMGFEMTEGVGLVSFRRSGP